MSLWGQEQENQKPVSLNPIAKQLDYAHLLISYKVEDEDGDGGGVGGGPAGQSGRL